MTFLFLKHSYQHLIDGKEKRILTEMTIVVTRFHLLSLFVIIYHLLSLVVIRCTTRGHSFSLSLVCLIIKVSSKTSKDQNKTSACALQNKKQCSDEIEIFQGKCGIMLQQT